MPNYLDIGYSNLLTKEQPQNLINDINASAIFGFNAVTFDKTTLDRLNPKENIQSRDFITGSAGWQIKGNGDVEFNDGTFRGTLDAATIEGGTIIGATIKTADEAYPDVLIDSSGLTLHGEKAIFKSSNGTQVGTIGGGSTADLDIKAASGKNIDIDGEDVLINAIDDIILQAGDGSGGYIGFLNTHLALDGGAGNIIFTKEFQPYSNNSTDIGDNTYKVKDVYAYRLRLISTSIGDHSSPQSGDIINVGGKLGIYNGSAWVVVGSQS